MAKNENQKPVQIFRAGAVSVSIWERTHEDKTYYTATASRAYTEDNGATWSYADSFDRDQLPVVSRLLDMAFAWTVAKGGK